MLAIALFLLPFLIWDALLFVMRQRGDRTPERRTEILRHFSEEDIAIGRKHTLDHNQLTPLSRSLFYLYFCVMLFGGVSAFAESESFKLANGSWLIALPLYILFLILTSTVLFSPVEAYREFVIERRAGLSTTSVKLWLLDQLKGLIVGWIFASILAYPIIALITYLPRIWPLPTALAIIAFLAFTFWVSPWIIAPLFNRFTPLENESLAEKVKSLFAQLGITVEKILIMDASRRSNYLNAYFTGLGNSRRVVLYDTLAQACPEPEILSVVAHELGHWKHNHILKLFFLEGIGLTSGLVVFKLALDSAAFRQFFHLQSPSSLQLLLLLPFLTSLLGKITAPVLATISRRFERQADQMAFHLTQNPQAFISLEKRLVQRAKADLLIPKWIHSWHSSHPLPEERIQAAEACSAPEGISQENN